MMDVPLRAPEADGRRSDCDLAVLEFLPPREGYSEFTDAVGYPVPVEAVASEAVEMPSQVGVTTPNIKIVR
jgi:hypothetical protein